MSSSMMEKAGQIHAIGYGLEDISFEADRDFRVRVAGIEVSARRGETSRMPYWVGRTLEDNGYGRVNLPDMITALKQALAKERIGGPREFQALEPLFYVKLKESMRRLEGRDHDKVHGMLLELFRMRNAKIVTKASSMKLSMDIKKRLTVEEQAFYNEINCTCNEFEVKITRVPSGPADGNDNSRHDTGSSVDISVTDLSGSTGSENTDDAHDASSHPAGARPRAEDAGQKGGGEYDGNGVHTQ